MRRKPTRCFFHLTKGMLACRCSLQVVTCNSMSSILTSRFSYYMSQRLVFTGTQATYANSAECCYETTFVCKLSELKVLVIKIVPMEKHCRTMQLKLPISLKIGSNVGFGE